MKEVHQVQISTTDKRLHKEPSGWNSLFEHPQTTFIGRCQKLVGPDSLHPSFLKEVAGTITKTISQIFKVSLCTKVVPTDRKTAFVTSLFKKGGKARAENYFTITSIAAKNPGKSSK